MTEREKEILDLIKRNPLISQSEIAKKLNITRSSVAVHIANLTKKGYIGGRGYIVNEMDYVTVIGAANIDIHGFTEEKLILKDSNPGRVNICLGGVGRNISENLTRLDVDTKLITAIGDDVYGRKLVEECKLIGIDMDHALILNDMSSSIYLAIMDEDGDMALALSDMTILEKMSVDYIKSKSYIINKSKVIVIDTGLSQEVIEYILANFKDNKIFLDPVSVKKARKVKELIGSFHTIKLNKLEAEYLSDIEIKDREDLEKASLYFINKGVQRVFITLGEKGVFYRKGDYVNTFKPPKIKVVNATGAGDAFMAGIVYCTLKEENIDYTARFGSAASILALSNENTVNQTMCLQNINNIMKEMF